MRKTRILDALRAFVEGGVFTAVGLAEQIGCNLSCSARLIRALHGTGVIYRAGSNPPATGVAGRWSPKYALGPGKDVPITKVYTRERKNELARLGYARRRDSNVKKPARVEKFEARDEVVVVDRRAKPLDEKAKKAVEELATRNPFLYGGSPKGEQQP